MGGYGHVLLIKCKKTGKLSAAKCQKVKHERDKIPQKNEAYILGKLVNCHLVPQLQESATHNYKYLYIMSKKSCLMSQDPSPCPLFSVIS